MTFWKKLFFYLGLVLSLYLCSFYLLNLKISQIESELQSNKKKILQLCGELNLTITQNTIYMIGSVKDDSLKGIITLRFGIIKRKQKQAINAIKEEQYEIARYLIISESSLFFEILNFVWESASRFSSDSTSNLSKIEELESKIDSLITQSINLKSRKEYYLFIFKIFKPFERLRMRKSTNKATNAQKTTTNRIPKTLYKDACAILLS